MVCVSTFYENGEISISCTIHNGSPFLLYSFCTCLLHSLMWLTVSSLSAHSLHLLCSCILSMFLFYSRWVLHATSNWWFSLESEWQEVLSGLQDSFQYSNLSQVLRLSSISGYFLALFWTRLQMCWLCSPGYETI